MKRISFICALLALGLSLSVPTVAQTSTSKVKAPSVKAYRSSTTKKAVAAADKVSGIVSGNVAGTSFKVGSKTGTYTVDASDAKCTRNGRSYSLSDLKGGTMVTVSGKVTGKSIKANTVKVNYVRTSKNRKSAESNTKATTKKSG